MLGLLDDTCLHAGASDRDYVVALHTRFDGHAAFPPPRFDGESTFVVSHFAGDVTYHGATARGERRRPALAATVRPPLSQTALAASLWARSPPEQPHVLAARLGR